MSTTDSRRKAFGMTFPALNGETVQQGHADYCAEHGHAKHRDVDGNVSAYCPRCGAVRETPAAGGIVTGEEAEVILGMTETGVKRLVREGYLMATPGSFGTTFARVDVERIAAERAERDEADRLKRLARIAQNERDAEDRRILAISEEAGR